MFYFLDCAET